VLFAVVGPVRYAGKEPDYPDPVSEAVRIQAVLRRLDLTGYGWPRYGIESVAGSRQGRLASLEPVTEVQPVMSQQHLLPKRMYILRPDIAEKKSKAMSTKYRDLGHRGRAEVLRTPRMRGKRVWPTRSPSTRRALCKLNHQRRMAQQWRPCERAMRMERGCDRISPSSRTARLPAPAVPAAKSGQR